jgi:hypothetical protein
MVRKLRLMKKHMQKWVFSSSASYQICFWRMKFMMMRSGKDFHPKHLVMAKKLSNLVAFTRRKHLQAGWFKVMIMEQSPNKSPRMSRTSSMPAQEVDPQEIYGSSQMREDIAGRISTTEQLAFARIGGAQLIAAKISTQMMRKIVYSFAYTRAFSDMEPFQERMRELREDNQILYDDNTNLRQDNRALIENLERTSINFNNLSKQLDQMRIARMVRVITNMLELPIFEAFDMLKAQSEDFSP